jgi:hypothetical protein
VVEVIKQENGNYQTNTLSWAYDLMNQLTNLTYTSVSTLLAKYSYSPNTNGQSSKQRAPVSWLKLPIVNSMPAMSSEIYGFYCIGFPEENLGLTLKFDTKLTLKSAEVIKP